MANNSTQVLYFPDGYTLPNPGNSFVSQWLDKRSSTSVSISVVFSGANAPTGSLTVETSNAPDTGLYGFAGGSPPKDVSTFSGTGGTTAITAVGTTKLEIVSSAHWIRVKYVSSADVSGLSINVWVNSPFQSP